MAAGYNDVPDTIKRGAALMSAVRDEAYKPVVEAFNRVCNLASKAEDAEVEDKLFEQAEEGALYASWQEAHKQYEAAADSTDALAALSSLQEPITAYFDHVMVMAKDESVKRNRLAMLKHIAADLNRFADFSKLVWA